MNVRHGKYRELYSMPPSSVRHILESGFFGVLKNRDREGRVIGFMRIRKIWTLKIILKTYECIAVL
jgi:hypothetical protein